MTIVYNRLSRPIAGVKAGSRARDRGIVLLFGWHIVGYLFLAGAGSGAFLFSAAGCMLDAVRRSDATERFVLSTQVGFYAAPALTAVAALLLVLDLGGIDRAWRVALMPFQSVVSMGAWLVGLFVLASGTLAAAGLSRSHVPRWLLWPGCVLGSLLAMGVMTYTGVLLAGMASIDFWHTPLLVALFAASSLSTGSATVTALDVFALPSSEGLSPHLWGAATWATAVEAVVLAAFVIGRWLFTPTARASVARLLSGDLSAVFWFGVVSAGIALPLALHVAGRLLPQRAAVVASSASVLVGGLLLRYCIVAAAQYTPMV